MNDRPAYIPVLESLSDEIEERKTDLRKEHADLVASLRPRATRATADNPTGA